jgi:hypothetical protein
MSTVIEDPRKSLRLFMLLSTHPAVSSGMQVTGGIWSEESFHGPVCKKPACSEL